MIYSLFMTPFVGAWTEDVDDYSDSRYASAFMDDGRFNILYQRIEQMELDDTETRTIAYPNQATSDWKYLVVRVIGSAHFNLSGFDTDGVTAITAKIPYYGTSLLPGIGFISTYNVTSLQLESDADGTKIEVYAAVSCADDNALLVTNDI